MLFEKQSHFSPDYPRFVYTGEWHHLLVSYPHCRSTRPRTGNLQPSPPAGLNAAVLITPWPHLAERLCCWYLWCSHATDGKLVRDFLALPDAQGMGNSGHGADEQHRLLRPWKQPYEGQRKQVTENQVSRQVSIILNTDIQRLPLLLIIDYLSPPVSSIKILGTKSAMLKTPQPLQSFILIIFHSFWLILSSNLTTGCRNEPFK